jgi:hypothetical protein
MSLPSWLPSLKQKSEKYKIVQFRLCGKVSFLSWYHKNASWSLGFILSGAICLLESQSSILVVSICISIFVLSVNLEVDSLCPNIDFIREIFSPFRICLFSVAFYFRITLILWTLPVKLFMAIDSRPRVCVILLMFVLTSPEGLCCVWFIYPILCWCWWTPCGGGVEYLHRDPASRRGRRKGRSPIWDSKIWPRVLWDSDQKRLRWRGPAGIVNDRPGLSSERAHQINRPATVRQ